MDRDQTQNPSIRDLFIIETIRWFYIISINSMEKNPSWEANSHLVNQIPAFYGTWSFITVFRGACHQSILSQMNPVLTFLPYFPKINFNIVLISMPSSSEWSLPFRLLNQNCSHISHIPYVCCIPEPPQHPWFAHSNNIWWIMLIMELIMQFSSASCHIIPLRSKYSLKHPSDTLNLWFSLDVRDKVFHP
jgi:hypothetical protein